jgi:hypothetical protein
MAGSDMAKTTRYQCTLEVDTADGVLIAQVDLDKKPHVGARVRVLSLDNGTQRVMPAN